MTVRVSFSSWRYVCSALSAGVLLTTGVTAHAEQHDDTLHINFINIISQYDGDPQNGAGIRFGGALQEYLYYSPVLGYFDFTDNVHAEGNLTTSGALIAEGRTNLNGVAVFNQDDTSTGSVRMDSQNVQNLFFMNAGTDRIGIGTSNPKAFFDVVGTVSGSSIQGFGLTDCSTSGQALQWSASSGTFSCGSAGGTLQSHSYIDTTSTSLVDANTTDYWTDSAENNNSHPHIALSNSSDSVFGIYSYEYTSNSTSDAQPVIVLTRNVGSNPTCGTSTALPGNAGTYTTNSGIIQSTTTTFLDSPGSTTATYYTPCSSTATSGNTGHLTFQRVTLFEVTNSNDLAEIYPTNDPTLQVGEVVSIDPNLPAGIRRSASAGDKTALGVVSTDPAMVIGGTKGEGKTGKAIALAGRVPVKVTTENGPVAIGDFLTSSSTPGTAMKARHGDPVIGQALTAFDGSTGNIGAVTMFVRTGGGSY